LAENFLGKEFELENAFEWGRVEKGNQLYLPLVASANHDIAIFAGEYLVRNN